MCSYQEGGQDPMGDNQQSGVDSHTTHALGTCRASLGNTVLHTVISCRVHGHKELAQASS